MADHYGNPFKEYEMGGTPTRTLEMNTENSIWKEIGRPIFGLDNYIKMDLKGILCVRMWSGLNLIKIGCNGCGNELSRLDERQ